MNNQSVMKEEIDEIFAYYNSQRDKNSQEMVVSLLRELQEVQGCLTGELKQRVIETTGVTANVLQCLIRMYPSLKEANTSHTITVCTGQCCAKKGSFDILNALKKELSVSKSGISADGVFELRTQNCLKNCRTAPNVMIDDVLYSGKELSDIRNLLERVIHR